MYTLSYYGTHDVPSLQSIAVLRKKKKELIVSIDKHLIKAYKKSSCLHAHDSLFDFYHFMIKSPKKHMPVTN